MTAATRPISRLRELDKWRPALTDEQYQAQLVILDEHIDDELKCTLTATGKFCVSKYIKMSRMVHSKLD